MKKLSVFLALSISLASVGTMANSGDSDQRMCERYKERLQTYKREGVLGINPATGRTQRMPREQAQEVIRDAEENVRIFCSPVGRTR